jgi:hypothetical protein
VAAVGALARLAAARARRRPAGWLLSVIGIALVIGYAGGVVTAATVTADRSARAVLRSIAPTDRAVRLTWQGVVTPRVRTQALALLRRLGLAAPAEIVLMNPVRLGGTVVRPAAITPLQPWVTAPVTTGSCTPHACTTLLASPSPVAGRGLTGAEPGLTAPGVHLTVTGATTLRSPEPLGFVPGTGDGLPPLLLSGDARGLDRLSGLDAIYRTHSWIAPLGIGALHAWQLAGFSRRLRRAQAQLLAANSGFSMSAPFAALDTAHSEARAAPQRLWLAGGGAAAALIMFVVLAAGAVRRDQARELERLRNAGARSGQLVAFVAIESTLLCGSGVLLGALAGLAAAGVLAHATGSPTGAMLSHSLLSPEWAAALAATWVLGSALLAAGTAVRGGRSAGALAFAAAAALAGGLAVSSDATGRDPLAVLIAPLCALAGGVLVFRFTATILRSAERAARRGPVLVRLALVGLARAPAAPALAVACLAVSVGLGGFALSYRATLIRGAADEAANQVPLDGLIAPGSGFTRPLDVASLSGWRARVGGTVWPVRRTDATFVSGGASVTVPALGIPAEALPQIHGWRDRDGSAPLAALADRLVPSGPVRTPGAPVRTRVLTVPIDSPHLGLGVTAILRAPDGAIRRVSLGTSSARSRTLRSRVPAGNWELDGLQLREDAGLEATNGHQNGENVAAATQFTAAVTLGPVNVAGAVVGEWRGAGAVSDVRRLGSGAATLRFSTNAVSGLVRPPQPSDARPVPVLIGPSVPRVPRLALTVDGQPVTARVVGRLRRFPTSGGGGFVIADEATLAAALDAQSPGEGAPDELWQAGGHRAAPVAGLVDTWRADVERGLRTTPVAHAIVGAMIAAAALATALAIVGLLLALLGSMRDGRVEADLIAQGLSPRELRRELRLRILIASVLGVAAGMVIAVVLTSLALAAVRAGLGLAPPQPPLVTDAPWGELAVLAAVALGACGLAAVIGSRAPGANR